MVKPKLFHVVYMKVHICVLAWYTTNFSYRKAGKLMQLWPDLPAKNSSRDSFTRQP